MQYTEAKTVEVPFTRDGMYYKEFPVMMDYKSHFTVHLEPGTGAKLTIYTKRFANQPTLTFPWDRREVVTIK